MRDVLRVPRIINWTLVAVATLWVGIGTLAIYNNFQSTREREGYERGVYQTTVYNLCTGEYPSLKFQAENWNLINLPNDCRFIKAVRTKELCVGR